MHSCFHLQHMSYSAAKTLCSTQFGKDFVNFIEFGAMSGPMNVLDLNSKFTKNLQFAVPKPFKNFHRLICLIMSLRKTAMFSSVKVVPLHLCILSTRITASFDHLLHERKVCHDSWNSSKPRNSREMVH